MYRNKISAVYKIVNTITNDCYVGSSKNVMKRWAEHKCPSKWKEQPNSQLYQDMQKYGVDKFRFQILCPVMSEHLKDVEQELIEMIQPTYNDRRANGVDVGRYKNAHKKTAIKHGSQACFYNGESLTLSALANRFRRAGIENPNLEAKKFLLDNNH